jgi:hypothetical protein
MVNTDQCSQKLFHSQWDILRVFSVESPLKNIVCNIIPDVIQFFIVASNMFVKSRLPLEFIAFIAAAFCRDSSLEGSDNNRQRPPPW